MKKAKKILFVRQFMWRYFFDYMLDKRLQRIFSQNRILTTRPILNAR